MDALDILDKRHGSWVLSPDDERVQTNNNDLHFGVSGKFSL